MAMRGMRAMNVRFMLPGQPIVSDICSIAYVLVHLSTSLRKLRDIN